MNTHNTKTGISIGKMLKLNVVIYYLFYDEMNELKNTNLTKNFYKINFEYKSRIRGQKFIQSSKEFQGKVNEDRNKKEQ